MIPEDNSKKQTSEKENIGATGEKKIAVNPNPRANENLPEKDLSDKNSEAGSEITDGEGG